MPDRQRDAERRAIARFTLYFNVAAVLSDDTVGQRQPEPRAFADRFGREEGIEDTLHVFRRDAAAGIGDFNPGFIRLPAGAQLTQQSPI